MTQTTNRRKFLASAATAAFTIVPRHVLGAPFVPPSDKITMAHVGMGTEGLRELGDLLADPGIQLVAVCDPNKDSRDYVDWDPHGIRNVIRKLTGQPNWGEGVEGIPGGREVGRQVINTYYANHRSQVNFKGCASYADFRELLDREKDLDAVKIMTPDHLHATISIAAMKKGTKVLVHKPLSNRLYEARLVIDTARKAQVPTHFLPWNASNNLDSIQVISTWIKDGAIGQLREIHNWSMRPLWPQYPTLPTEGPSIPSGFDWDLWLGPALDRPYHPTYTHALFRGWYDFGGGSLADMGHYSLWSVFTVFDLGVPTSVEAEPSTLCTLENHVSRKLKNDVSFPAACRIRFKFPARGDMPALDLYWYDGGMKPYTPEELEEDNKELAIEGMMFVGDRGKILADFLGLDPRIIPEKKMREYQGPKPPPATETEDEDQGTPAERNKVWRTAFQGGPPSPGCFPNAGNISELVNLGAVALRAGGKITYDSEHMKITNVPEANKYFFREYRQGWEL